MSSISSSPTLFRSEEDSARTTPEAGPSTAASSPPNHDSSEYVGSGAPSEGSVDGEDEEVVDVSKALSRDEKDTEKRMARLQFVLQRSAVFSSILKTRMDEEKARQVKLQAEKRKQLAQAGSKRTRGAQASPKGKKRKGTDGKAQVVHEEPDEDDDAIFQQPALITGAKLKPYQLEGLQWMVSLDQNGISGILADEMGLGKTLQTIAFSAYLREHGNFKPFLVVCPLSVMHNWVDEYRKFAPTIPVCMYHGIPQERAELRATVMAPPGRGRKGKAGAKPKAKPQAPVHKGRGRPRKSAVVLESDEEEVVEEHGYTAKFPIVLTTYEMIIRDRKHLAHYDWGYIVVDEGHRLKNLDCKLMQEIKKYKSAGRMILTGTPLHNNLAELWALLNFILPDIFDDIQTFQDWFNLPELQSSLPTSQSQQIISSLHAILKPFLLRRMKIDVETHLPPKKEYVLYAPLSVRQRDAYDHVLDGGIRRWLIQGGTGNAEAVVKEDAKVETGGGEDPIVIDDSDDEEDVPLATTQSAKKAKEPKPRTFNRRVKGGRKSYIEDVDDDEYFDMVQRGEFDDRGLLKTKLSREEQAAEDARAGLEYQERMKLRQVNNMHLQNTVMQLRKVCSHPFLFEWPEDPATRDLVIGEELVYASGKMMVLDRLLKELFKRGHKVLLFSQFTTMLDIIEEWAVNFMGWSICRIDGSTKPLDRRSEMERFQTGGDAPDAPCLFLLSTRAGGLGINLVAADTVIFYDQDWNPQMDAQAQDRAHRIGQTKPVLIYRLVSAHTVETKIMQRAGEKRKLEALVIAKGKFKAPAAAAATTKRETMAEMAATLLRLEGEKIEVVPNTKEGKLAVLSDADLDALLDRSPDVFAERGVGWTSAKGAGSAAVLSAEASAGKKAAFAVYEAPPEEGSDALAKMMGEEDAENDPPRLQVTAWSCVADSWLPLSSSCHPSFFTNPRAPVLIIPETFSWDIHSVCNASMFALLFSMYSQQEAKNGNVLKRNMQNGKPTRTKSWTNYVGFVMNPCNFADVEADAAPWFHLLKSNSNLKLVDLEIHNFVAYMQPTDEEIKAREDLLQRFKVFIRKTFFNAIAVAPFGSYVTGLYLPTSDIDIALALPRQWQGLDSKIQLSAISTAIKASGFASHVEDVLNASVPLIKIRDQITSIDMDLTAFDGHAFRSTGLVQKWMQKDTELKTALVMVLKRFLAIRRCGTTYTGGINSYLLVWMVVAWVHLEWPKIKASASAPPYVAATPPCALDKLLLKALSTNAGVTKAPPVHLLPLYTHALLHFFKFYGQTFRYECQAIEIEPTPCIKYKPPTAKRPYLFSISDPADPSIDMGSKVYGIKHIQATFSHAYVALQQITRVLELGDGRSSQFPHGILHYLLYIS